MSDPGHIIGGPADPDYDGAVLTADVALGDTVLHVDDPGDFDEDAADRGAVLLVDLDVEADGSLDPSSGSAAAYLTYDDDAGTVTLAAPAAFTASSGDRVYIQDPVSGKPVGRVEVLVAVDGGDQTGDSLPAYVDVSLLESVGDVDLTDLAVDLDEDDDGQLYVSGFPGLTQAQGRYRWQYDYATATGNTDVTIKLTYRPVPDTSVKVSWGGVGLDRNEWDFTDPWTIVVPAQGFHADDPFEAHYAYTDPATRPVVPASLTLIGYTTATAGGAVALPAGTEAGHLIVIAAANYAPSAAPATTDARILVQHHDVNATAIGGAANGGGVLAAYGVEDGSGTAVTVTSTGDTAIILAVFAYTGALDSLWIALRDAVADGHNYAVDLPAAADMGIALLAGHCGVASAPFSGDTSGDWNTVAFISGTGTKATTQIAYTTGPHDGVFHGLSTPSIWSAMSIGLEEG